MAMEQYVPDIKLSKRNWQLSKSENLSSKRKNGKNALRGST